MKKTYDIYELDILPNLENLEEMQAPTWFKHDIINDIENGDILWEVNASYKIATFELKDNQDLFDINIIKKLFDLDLLSDDLENYKIYDDWSDHSDGDYIYIEYKKKPSIYITIS